MQRPTLSVLRPVNGMVSVGEIFKQTFYVVVAVDDCDEAKTELNKSRKWVWTQTEEKCGARGWKRQRASEREKN